MTATASTIQRALEHHCSGELSLAEDLYRQVLRIDPQHADALHLSGVVAYQQGCYRSAIERINRAVVHSPDNAAAHCNLGSAYQAAGQLDAALRHFERSIRLAPTYAEAHFNLGNAFKQLGRFDEAVAGYRRAVEIKPEYSNALNNLGNLLQAREEFEEAIGCFERVVSSSPDFAEAHYNLGNALQGTGDLDRAIDSYRRALQIKPDYADAHHNLGNTLAKQEKHEQAIGCFTQAVALAPNDSIILQSYFLALGYDGTADSDMLFDLHCRWGKLQRHLSIGNPPHRNTPDPQRRLKVGYVSPDFRTHSVAMFIEPILADHDPSCVETTCYAEVAAPDGITERLKTLAHRWRSTVGLSDEQMAEMIRRDGIDVLIDLAGHTAGNRLGLFARRPAPVQITYLGYGNTTGLECIDFRLTDAIADPVGEPIRHTEELIRLARGILCFRPPHAAPAVSRLPALENDSITFGSFNRHAKLNRNVVRLWAGILAQIDSSRLILKNSAFRDSAIRTSFRAQFRAHGISCDRIDLVAHASSMREHLQWYDRIDIALDPFPYNGSTTTCEAMWMGVPVVTLRGDSYVGRMTASLLTHVDLEEFIAETPEDYAALAAQLAGDVDRLSGLRHGLRSRVVESRLCDARGYTRELEAVYRHVWRRWCKLHDVQSRYP